jgi:hypothetical protein
MAANRDVITREIDALRVELQQLRARDAVLQATIRYRELFFKLTFFP